MKMDSRRALQITNDWGARKKKIRMFLFVCVLLSSKMKKNKPSDTWQNCREYEKVSKNERQMKRKQKNTPNGKGMKLKRKKKKIWKNLFEKKNKEYSTRSSTILLPPNEFAHLTCLAHETVGNLYKQPKRWYKKKWFSFVALNVTLSYSFHSIPQNIAAHLIIVVSIVGCFSLSLPVCLFLFFSFMQYGLFSHFFILRLTSAFGSLLFLKSISLMSNLFSSSTFR